MAKVTIVMEDKDEGFEVSTTFEPEVDPDKFADEEAFLESLTDAQYMAMLVMDYIETEVGEDEEDEANA